MTINKRQSYWGGQPTIVDNGRLGPDLAAVADRFTRIDHLPGGIAAGSVATEPRRCARSRQGAEDLVASPRSSACFLAAPELHRRWPVSPRSGGRAASTTM
jgi:hypothetical protein